MFHWQLGFFTFLQTCQNRALFLVLSKKLWNVRCVYVRHLRLKQKALKIHVSFYVKDFQERKKYKEILDIKRHNWSKDFIWPTEKYRETWVEETLSNSKFTFMLLHSCSTIIIHDLLASQCWNFTHKHVNMYKTNIV